MPVLVYIAVAGAGIPVNVMTKLRIGRSAFYFQQGQEILLSTTAQQVSYTMGTRSSLPQSKPAGVWWWTLTCM